MTLREAIEFVDDIKPNSFSLETKIKWVSVLEGRMALEIFLMAPVEVGAFDYTEKCLDHELLVYPPFDDVYTAWLCACIDRANGEDNKYQNSMAIYNAKYSDFLRWFCQRYDPVQGHLSEEALSEYGKLGA